MIANIEVGLSDIDTRTTPGQIEFLFRQGNSLVAVGRFAEGLTVLSQLLELNPNHYKTLEVMGDLYAQLGKKARARQLWQLAFNQRATDLNLLKKIGRSIDCSIIIPVFNQLKFTKGCLHHLKKNTPKNCYEIIVVDNHSTDGTNELLSCLQDIKVITNKKNLGFAKACNQGAQAAANEFILFLNNDIEVQPGWLSSLILTLLEDSEVAVVGSKLLHPDGKIQHAGVITVDNREYDYPLPWHVYVRYDGTLPQANIPREYAAVTGACLLTRKSIFEKLGCFDESYRNGYEDVDYCYKVGTAGYKIIYRPESVAIHYESQSGPQRFTYEDANFAQLVSKWSGKIPIDIRLLAEGKRDVLRPFKKYSSPARANIPISL